jgi:hypothetical protein
MVKRQMGLPVGMSALLDGLAQIVREVVAGYVCPSPNATMYLLEDAERQVYGAVSVPHHDKNKVRVVVLARVEQDKVMIEADITDKPLYEALDQAGVARQHIVLAYAGQTAPTV